MRSTDDRYRAELAMAGRLRDTFIRDHAAREIKWSGHNLARLLRSTGERPARIAEMRAILGELGLDTAGYPRWIGPGGVFDHGEFWGKAGKPWALVGHPYGIRDEYRRLLAELAGFGTLRVAVDDRPSYYGFGTNHVRVELAEYRRPYDSIPSSRRTRTYARAARKAIQEVFGPDGGGAC